MNEETLDLFSTFLNDYTKDTLYRDMAMKEQNRHLARIASALEKLSGGTALSEHNERYEQKLEVDKQAEQIDVTKTEKVEEVKELETQTYTHDDLKALCLSKSREDVANKPKLKALLKEFGAAKVLDVKSKEDLTTIIDRINSGEF